MPTNSRSSVTALLIVDMINDFRFAEGEKLFKYAFPAAKAAAGLKEKFAAKGDPVIYVNDNFRHWQDSFAKTVLTVEESSAQGQKMVELLRPTDDDYNILKPHRSGFYKTPLELLLDDLKVETVVIAGVTTDMCVLTTALDAHLRGYRVVIPSKCSASITPSAHRQALDLARRTVGAEIPDKF